LAHSSQASKNNPVRVKPIVAEDTGAQKDDDYYDSSSSEIDYAEACRQLNAYAAKLKTEASPTNKQPWGSMDETDTQFEDKPSDGYSSDDDHLEVHSGLRATTCDDHEPRPSHRWRFPAPANEANAFPDNDSDAVQGRTLQHSGTDDSWWAAIYKNIFGEAGVICCHGARVRDHGSQCRTPAIVRKEAIEQAAAARIAAILEGLSSDMPRAREAACREIMAVKFITAPPQLLLQRLATCAGDADAEVQKAGTEAMDHLQRHGCGEVDEAIDPFILPKA